MIYKNIFNSVDCHRYEPASSASAREIARLAAALATAISLRAATPPATPSVPPHPRPLRPRNCVVAMEETKTIRYV